MQILLKSTRHRTLLLCCALLSIAIHPDVFAASTTAAAKRPAEYRLGIFPYLAPRQTVELYGPVAENLQQALGHRIKLESLPSFTEFTRALSQQTYDIALIQPFDYPEVVEKQGYLPLARLSVPLVTQLYVRDDSKYQQLADLRGTTIALPPAQSANARMTLRTLIDNKIIPGKDVQIRYFSSHDSCIQQVWIGKASACGTALPPITIFQKRMQAKLRPIYDTPAIPHILFVVHPRVPAEQRQKIAEVITGWKDTEAGKLILKNLSFPGFTPVQSGEYDVMRGYLPVTAQITPVTKSTKEVILGVFPYFAPRQLAKNFATVLPELSRAAEKPVQFRSAINFGSFMDNVAAGQYDIIFIQPFDYARATHAGYLPVAAMQARIQGVFFALEKSSIHQLSDFNGKMVAMPAEDSAVAILGRHALLQAGMKPGKDVSIDYRINHESCLQQVQQGAAVACITTEMAINLLPAQYTEGLRGVAKTESVPGLLFMVHRRMPEKLRAQLQSEIIGWKDSPDGKAILKSIGVGDFTKVNISEYESMPAYEGSR